jgi:hypothetical protein
MRLHCSNPAVGSDTFDEEAPSGYAFQSSGNWGRIVVVKTKPGHSPTPGHPGTGTIVATFCP